MNLAQFSAKKLMDVDTRYQHMSEIAEVYDDIANLIERRSYIGKDDRQKIEKFQMMAREIRNLMQDLSDYDMEINTIRLAVDMVNDVKPETIYGGRGTELEAWTPGKPTNWGT